MQLILLHYNLFFRVNILAMQVYFEIAFLTQQCELYSFGLYRVEREMSDHCDVRSGKKQKRALMACKVGLLCHSSFIQPEEIKSIADVSFKIRNWNSSK